MRSAATTAGSQPTDSTSEIGQLGYNLQTAVFSAMGKKARVEARLAYYGPATLNGRVIRGL